MCAHRCWMGSWIYWLLYILCDEFLHSIGPLPYIWVRPWDLRITRSTDVETLLRGKFLPSTVECWTGKRECIICPSCELGDWRFLDWIFCSRMFHQVLDLEACSWLVNCLLVWPPLWVLLNPLTGIPFSKAPVLACQSNKISLMAVT